MEPIGVVFMIYVHVLLILVFEEPINLKALAPAPSDYQGPCKGAGRCDVEPYRVHVLI